MSTASAGRAREHRTRDRLTETGWRQVMRSAGSKGSADILVGHPIHGAALVQVGTDNKEIRCKTKDCDHNNGSAAQCARDRFLDDAELVCALPLLATWSRAGVRYFVVTRDTPSTWTEFQP